jgi:hypothetical protein
VAGAWEIADHLAPYYRISNINQLAVITVSNVNNAADNSQGATTGNNAGGIEVGVRPDPTSSAFELLPGNTVAYNLCGVHSTDCSIAVGTASPDRTLLLRREALELALYTFKYIKGTNNVLALLPPGHSVAASTLTPKPPTSSAVKSVPVSLGLLFLRNELQPFLSAPLNNTLPLEFPPLVSQVPEWLQTQEAALVEQVTAHGMFSSSISKAQDGSNLILLDPLPPQ